MSSFKIIKFPNSFLRKKAEELKEVDEETKKTAANMIETLEKNQGLGLAAPQVGISKRIIVVMTDKGPEVFINPQILKKSKESEKGEEGCLSFPGLFLKVKRSKEVLVEALDKEARPVQVEAKELPARIFQHEIDHLNGILFIDRISFWQRWKIKDKLKKIE